MVEAVDASVEVAQLILDGPWTVSGPQTPFTVTNGSPQTLTLKYTGSGPGWPASWRVSGFQNGSIAVQSANGDSNKITLTGYWQQGVSPLAQ